MELKWQTPSCVPAEPKPNLVFTTLEELIQATAEFQSEGFVELALDELTYGNGLTNRSILATYDEGYEWTVVGFIVEATSEEVEALGLPKWKAKYREAAKE